MLNVFVSVLLEGLQLAELEDLETEAEKLENSNLAQQRPEGRRSSVDPTGTSDNVTTSTNTSSFLVRTIPSSAPVT